MLFMTLLRFFFGPLADFMKKYIEGMKEQAKSKVEMENTTESDNETGRGATQRDQERIAGAPEQNEQDIDERHAALSGAYFIHLSMIACFFAGPSSSRYLSKSARRADPLGKAKPKRSKPVNT